MHQLKQILYRKNQQKLQHKIQRYAEGKSKFSEHVLNEGHEMKTIEETMSIIHLENNHRKRNTLEEIEILKAASSKHLLNDVIAGQNDPIYKLLPTSGIWTPRSTAQAKQQTKIQNFKNQHLQNQWFKLQLSTAQARDRSDFNTHKTCWKFVITTKGLQDRNNLLLDGRTVEKKKKCKLIQVEVRPTVGW